MQSYLFYDIESTGLNKVFDQVLHFAAIRTDMHFNELEHYELKVKLNPDAIPSPGAMITHRMPLSEIAKGISEYAAIKQIHQWMNVPGTISLGYNTLGFDDEFLRFSFYRNLLPPYTHQYANRCGRMDIYPIAILYYLYKDSVIQWPKIEGKPSFKLAELNNINQFVNKNAHHAMADVEMTIALARKFSEENKMWEYVCGYFNKDIERQRIEGWGSDCALFVMSKLGAERHYQSQVLSVGNHLHYKNQSLWLRLDDKNFTAATKETLLDSVYVLRKKLGEPGFLLPMQSRFMKYLDPAQIELAESNKRWLQENPSLFRYLADHHCNYKYPEFPETDVDASLYLNGFWSQQEEYLCSQFHVASPTEKAQLIEKITNPRLYSLALRILGRHFPQYLNDKQAAEFAIYMQRTSPANETIAIMDYKGRPRLTPVTAIQEIKTLRDSAALDAEQHRLLNELEQEILLRR